MRQTTVTIQRPEGTVYATGVRVQIDQMSTKEVLDHMAALNFRGHDAFKLYTLDWNPSLLIRRGDVLIDETAIDPDTINSGNPLGTNIKYRVVSRPKNYDYDHQELVGEVVLGQ